MPEIKVGKISHYFGHINVAAIELTEGGVKVGDKIHVKGKTTDFQFVLDSIQIEHNKVNEAKKGESIGVKVPQHAREHDEIFVVTD